jgi:hypothetical protein
VGVSLTRPGCLRPAADGGAWSRPPHTDTHQGHARRQSQDHEHARTLTAPLARMPPRLPPFALCSMSPLAQRTLRVWMRVFARACIRVRVVLLSVGCAPESDALRRTWPL